MELQDLRSKARWLVTTLAVVGGFIFAHLMLGAFTLPVREHTHVVTTHHLATDGSSAELKRAIRAAWPARAPERVEFERLEQFTERGYCEGPVVRVEVQYRALPFAAINRDYQDVLKTAAPAGLGPQCSGKIFSVQPPPHASLLAPPAALFAGGVMLLAWRSRRGRRGRINWADWAARVEPRTALSWGAACAAAMFAFALLVEAISAVTGWPLPGHPLQPDSRAALAPLLPLAVIAAPVFEEYLFRAWMLERLTRILPAWVALGWSSGAFAAIHLPGNVLAGVIYLGLGVLLGLLWLRTRSLFACVLAHAAYNAAVSLSLWMELT